MSNRKQLKKIENTYSNWMEIGVTHGSVLRPLLSLSLYDMKNSDCEKLLGVKLDWKLNFDDDDIQYNF